MTRRPLPFPFASLLLFAALFAAVSCAAPSVQEVRQHGLLREIAHEGRTEGRVALSAYAQDGWVGVGALAGLAGEVTILNGNVLVARGDPTAVEQLGRDPPADLQATFLVAAPVASWRRTSLPAGADLAAIERAVAAAVPGAAEQGALPVPFLVSGKRATLALHVVRGKCMIVDAPPEEQPARWSNESDEDALEYQLAGFFAPGREGELTHRGTALHVHAFGTVRDEDGVVEAQVMGHVDAFTAREQAWLFVPADR